MDLHQWLQQAAEAFNMQLAIISDIDDNRYVVVEAYSSLDLVKAGDEFAVDMTYCANVVNLGKIVAYEQVGAMTKMCLHPCYQAMHLESYIGIPLVVKNKIIGTLNFSSLEPRTVPFEKQDIQMMEFFASQYLEYREAEPSHELPKC
ncbi:GAF domain-containing protein [Agarivorans sp. MS3-6]|uniref:GAF domain-containing protein n=1 Tax=Agarivorans sp. TSD2052 TaxID=2937286 RepID=UPI00200ED2EE|nr:GAF domain-containing protein [Agarivorans sp. TSD2052]UPW19272.1 GAF domain-containing protein [Agarivorans sp. TSD2052]